MKNILIFIFLFLVLFLSFKFVFAKVLPAGPGLGWHNDWWNPETKKVQDAPYKPSSQ